MNQQDEIYLLKFVITCSLYSIAHTCVAYTPFISTQKDEKRNLIFE